MWGVFYSKQPFRDYFVIFHEKHIILESEKKERQVWYGEVGSVFFDVFVCF